MLVKDKKTLYKGNAFSVFFKFEKRYFLEKTPAASKAKRKTPSGGLHLPGSVL